MPKGKVQQPPTESDESDEEGFDPSMLDMMGGLPDPHFSKKFLAELPPKVRDTVYVLQADDIEYEKLQKAHDAKVMELRRKYAKLAAPLFDARRKIVSGEEEPSEEQVKVGYPKEHEGQVSLTEGPKPEGDVVGVPDFWLDALRHHVIIDEMISERDEEALKHLVDISVELLDAPEHGFTLTFHFAKNEFFTNDKLFKKFILKELDDEFVLDKAEGSGVVWCEGKNLGVLATTKKQKNKKGQVRYVNKEEPCPTFFDFFKKDLGEDEEEQNHAMAETIKDKIVPFAVEYFTGEAPNGDSDMEDDGMEGEEDEEEEDDDDEDDEPAFQQPARGRARGGAAPAAPAGRGRGGRGGAGEAPPADCKQQ